MKTSMDKEELAAFVDGELTPEEAAAVVLHLADHPADQAYVDDLFAANAALADAFGAPASERVPDAILDTIDGAAVRAQILPFRLRPVGVAAGLALAAALSAVVVLLQPQDGPALALGPVMGGSALAEALDLMPSGAVTDLPDGRELMVLASFAVEGGHCREVEVLDRGAGQMELALVCLEAQAQGEGAGWQVEVVLQEVLETAAADGFVAAEGTEVAGLSSFLDARGAGLALTPEEEAAAIARTWGR
ncbi:anti-sigma factor [Tabrizicola sp. TH137]|uniref:anti-sigma factor family protein n=1 Tax=Tabrizicola sp. TH137 TaxID=2067452 RepID=UPI0011812BD7|nr:zf-HC2 domain-containing protein [Tabrizicola sp. TH137]